MMIIWLKVRRFSPILFAASFLVIYFMKPTIDSSFPKLYPKTRLGADLEIYHKQQLACVPPHLELWTPAVLKYFKEKPETKRLQCADEKNWVYVKNGTMRISQAAKDLHGNITCSYFQIQRKDDYSVDFGTEKANITNNITLLEDFFRATCTASDNATYTNVHAGLGYNEDIHARHKPINGRQPLNVLMMGFDSSSRMSWMRNLPEAHRY